MKFFWERERERERGKQSKALLDVKVVPTREEVTVLLPVQSKLAQQMSFHWLIAFADRQMIGCYAAGDRAVHLFCLPLLWTNRNTESWLKKCCCNANTLNNSCVNSLLVSINTHTHTHTNTHRHTHTNTHTQAHAHTHTLLKVSGSVSVDDNRGSCKT